MYSCGSCSPGVVQIPPPLSLLVLSVTLMSVKSQPWVRRGAAGGVRTGGQEKQRVEEERQRSLWVRVTWDDGRGEGHLIHSLCVCMCAREREQEKEKEKKGKQITTMADHVKDFFWSQTMWVLYVWVWTLGFSVTCHGACVLMFLYFYLSENKHQVLDLYMRAFLFLKGLYAMPDHWPVFKRWKWQTKIGT